MNFKEFLIESNLSDVHKTLRKLPNSHSELVKGYKFQFDSNNTLKNDNKHVGVIDGEKKTITIAAPWNYGREYTLLHEIAHLVWKKFISSELRKKWAKIVAQTKDKLKDTDEELFSMAYANFYANNKIEIHTHPTWEQFVKVVPK
jgi:hypothetical protein